MNKNYFRSLLAATLLVAGSTGAYAQDNYTSVYSKTVATWTTNDVTAWGGNANLAVDAANGLGFNTTMPTTAYAATKTFDIKDNAKVKYVVTWNTGNSTARETNYEYIQFGDKVRLSYNSHYKIYLNTDGTSSYTTEVAAFKGVTDYAITIIFNTATKSVESFTLSYKDAKKQEINADLTDKVSGALDGNMNSVTFGFHRAGRTGNWAFPNYIKNIEVSQAEQAVSTKPYTINYIADGTNIKTSSDNLAVGASITAEQTITVDGTKYIVAEGMAPTLTIAANGDNTLNVNVRKPYAATLKVTTNVNGESTEQVTNLVESDTHEATWSYAYPLYMKSGDSWYKADKTDAFGENGTFTDGQTIEKTVSYSTKDENIVFFADAPNNNTADVQYSNGETGNVMAQNARNRGISVGTLAAGNYEFVVNFIGVHKRSLVMRTGVEDPIVALQPTATGETKGVFALAAETADLWINGANSGEAKTNQSEDFDYVLVKKIAAPTVNINAASKLASFSAAYAVTVPDDVTVYIATAAANDGVTLKKLATKVIPANTGVLLYSAATGDKNLTIGGEADAASFEGNLFKATADGTFTATGAEYVLIKGEQSFAPVSADVVIPAGKAYVTVAAGGAKLAAIFGQTTAIEQVEAAQAANEATYNLAGQKVGKSYKGIVIKGGKKYVVR